MEINVNNRTKQEKTHTNVSTGKEVTKRKRLIIIIYRHILL